jgi:hypothetical protein
LQAIRIIGDNLKETNPQNEAKIKTDLVEMVGAAYRSASKCRKCFDEGVAEVGEIKFAQPSWVGASYEQSHKRVLIVDQNPRVPNSEEYLVALTKFRSGKLNLNNLWESDIRNGSRGRTSAELVTELGLRLEDTAIISLALCATKGSVYPRKLLRNCFTGYTSKILALLAPDISLLCGSNLRDGFRQFFDPPASNDAVIVLPSVARISGQELEETRSELRLRLGDVRGRG